MRHLLHREGAAGERVLHARRRDGPSAAAMARDADFDLMILDLGLPDMDGQPCCARSAAAASACR